LAHLCESGCADVPDRPIGSAYYRSVKSILIGGFN
jgi:hypothetical protein